MKPITITMQAFGSYLNHTTVDFTKLGENPIFLITGTTGGGKTTILDAMCFALYCRATGGRRSWNSMICTAAPKDAETIVEFVFSLGNETYRFFRSQQRYAARGTGAVKIKEEHSCYRLCGSEWSQLFSGAESRVREQAEQLLGLNCEQFSQVMVLPQGDFLKLLLANSRDKAQMFQTLFATQRWLDVTQKLKRMADEVQLQAKEIAASKNMILQQEETATPEELEQKCKTTDEQLEKAKTDLEQLKKELEQRNTELTAALELSHKFENMITLRADLEKLRSQEAFMQQKQNILAQSRAARGIYPYYNAFQNAQRDFTAKTAAYIAAQKSNEQAASDLKTALEQSKAIAQLREQATAFAQTFSRLEDALTGAQRREKIQIELTENEQKFAAENREYEKAAAALKEAQEHTLAGKAYMQSVQETSRMLPQLSTKVEQLIENDAAAALAAGLLEDSPCPVCGAVHHPSPARKSEELEKARNELEKAKQASDLLIKCEKRLRDLENLQQLAQTKLETGRTALSLLERNIASGKAAADEIAAGAGLLKKPAEIQQEIEAVTRKRKQCTEQADKLETRISAAQGLAAGSAAALKAAQQAYEESSAVLNDAKTKWNSEAAAVKWNPDFDFTKILLPPLQESTLEKELNNYSASLKSKEEQLAALEPELQGKEKPDLALAKEIQNEVQQKSSQLAQETGVLSRISDSARQSLKKLTELCAKGAELEDRFARTNRLSILLSGKSGLKIPLQQFVLGIMLDDILSCANTFFSTFSSGRYSLSRITGASGGNALGGLDLQVFDAYSGGARSVETLSGGELFLASLALAFGLSDVVQSYSGSVHLDSIFIDEGFGSLDQETLDTAMKALLQIQQKGRTIGIISHVSELKTRISAQIIVSKAENGGSKAEVVT